MIIQTPKNKNIKLSDHFWSDEVKCKCNYSNCTITYIDTKLLDYLENKRSELRHPLIINDAFRCTAHNRDVGGKKGSYHLVGKAADLHGEDAANYEDADGLGRYPGKNFVHIDLRGYKARWVG